MLEKDLSAELETALAGQGAVADPTTGEIYAAWGGSTLDGSRPVCFASRAPAGGWSVTDLGRRADGIRFELKVATDGTVYLLRGMHAPLEQGAAVEAKWGGQETLYLEQFQAGQWQTLQSYLGNTYPGQDNYYDYYYSYSMLDGDIDLDAAGNATLAWIDNGPAWEEADTFRLRTTQILSTTVPQVTKHYYANGQRIASRVDNELYYVLGDHLGSTSVVVDDSGGEVGHVIYDAYGAIVENTLPEGLTDRLYTDQVFDASTGLYYYNARYYDPYLGQFTQPDSLVADPLNPAGWNRFSYVYGNPINYTDPSGHFAIAPWDLLDIISFGASLNDFIREPTLGNLAWLALDTVSLLPLLPSIGAVHHLGKLDEVGDAVRVANRFDEGRAATSVSDAVTQTDELAFVVRGEDLASAANAKRIPRQITVIGHGEDTKLFRELLEETGETGYNVLHIPRGGGRRYGAGLNKRVRRWEPKVNINWLDSAIRRGDDIYLATDPTRFAPDELKRYFRMELDYLKSKGYVQQGLYMVKR